MDVLRSAAAIAFVFGLVIFIHELGHFIAAKLMRVYAPRFSIGFGPALWSRKWGETEYVLAAIPLGGYVRMASRDDETMAFIEGGNEQPTAPTAANRPRYWSEDGMAPFGPHPVPADRWFESKSYLARLFILVAGVSMNILLGFALFTGMALALGRPVLKTRVVDTVAPPAPAALAAGIAQGDTILAVGPVPVSTWNEFEYAVDSLPGDSITIRTQRASVTVAAGAPESAARQAILEGVQPFVAPVVEVVAPGGPAGRAGLRAGDSVVAVDGTPVWSWQQLRSRIEASPGRQITLEVARATGRATISVRPDSAKATDPVTKRDSIVGKIGVQVRQPETREPVSARQALHAGAMATWRAAGFVVLSLKTLATDRSSWKQIGGPVAIGEATAQAASRGWEILLSWLALLSINVAIFNLLPVPVLDGGNILIMTAERLKGGQLSIRTREYLMRAGLAFILLLLIVVMYNDVVSPLVRWLFKS